MATSKIATPNPAMFSSDPLEQIYAKQVLGGNNMGGLAYAFLQGEKADRSINQDRYLGGVSEANRMAAALAREEGIQKMREVAMKSATDLAKEGYDPQTMPGGRELFDPGAGSDVAKLMQDLLRAKAQQARSGGGGGGTKDYVEETRTMLVKGPDGNMYPVQVKAKNQDPLAARAALDKSAAGRGIVPTGTPVDSMTQALINQQAKKRYEGVE